MELMGSADCKLAVAGCENDSRTEMALSRAVGSWRILLKAVAGGHGAFICGCCSSLLFEQSES